MTVVPADTIEVAPSQLNLEGGEVKMATDVRKAGKVVWVDGELMFRVTSCLEILAKPALQYWYGKQVYLAVNANPGMSEKEALNAPYQISEDAKSRGTTIHSIVEAYKHSHEYIDGVPEQFRGYAQAFYKWTEDNHVEVVEHERTVVSREFGYAGTLDLLAKINGSELPIVVDIKTGKSIYPEAFLQLSAYRQALKEEGVEVGGVAVLLLQEDGSYQYQFTTNHYLRQFTACKILYEWLNREDIEKLKKYAKKGGGK
jgi:hypothetical protein